MSKKAIVIGIIVLLAFILIWLMMKEPVVEEPLELPEVTEPTLEEGTELEAETELDVEIGEPVEEDVEVEKVEEEEAKEE